MEAETASPVGVEMEFEKALENFLAGVSEIVKVGYASSVNANPVISAEFGKKYVRIVKEVFGQRSAYAFVGIEDGNVYKQASWKVPAKHARGNIYNETGLKACGVYSVAYFALKFN